MYYIQETDKLNFLFKQFNIIKLIGNKIILPVGEEKIKQKKAEKLAKKTKRILDKTNCNKLILSKTIKIHENYKNYLYTYNFEYKKRRNTSIYFSKQSHRRHAK